MKLSRLKFFLLYTLVCLIWGTTWTVIRVGENAALDPFLGLALRFFVASVVLWTWVIVRKVPLPKGKTEWKAAIINGILGNTCSYAIVYYTSQFVPSGLEAVIFGTMPLWTVLFLRLFDGHERLGMRRSIGVLLGFGGLLLTFVPNSGPGSTANIGAMALMLGAPFVSAISLVYTKRHAKSIKPVALNAVAIGMATLILVVVALSTNDLSKVHLNFTHLWTIGYLAVFGTVVTFISYYKLLQEAPAIVMSYVTIITPIIAVLVGWMLLHEHLDLYELAGAAVVLIGIKLTLTEQKTVVVPLSVEA